MRGGVRRRETSWFSAPSASFTLAAPNTAALVRSLNAAALALRPFTIVRYRGRYHIESDQSAASEFFDCSIGLAVVSDQATAIGVTAVPTPTTDLGSDLWFVYESLQDIFELGDATGFARMGISKDYDSRAMRKVEDGQDVVFVAENTAASNGVTVRDQGRMLVKLH